MNDYNLGDRNKNHTRHQDNDNNHEIDNMYYVPKKEGLIQITNESWKIQSKDYKKIRKEMQMKMENESGRS